MKKIENPYLKKIFVLLGSISLVLGVVGIVLPLLPTTPFLLLSAYFFSRSSEKFYNKLLNNKIFGKYIKNFREGNGITLLSKVVSVLSIWIAISTTIYFFMDNLTVEIVMVLVGLTVSYYLISLKTLK